MRKSNPGKVIAIACADLHLSQNAPAAREGEPDWFEAMKRPLVQLDCIAKQYQCPILCAGDIFHHWRSSPELINFALQYLPEMYAIPGQHDLPFHQMDDLPKSAFQTLVLAGRVQLIDEKGMVFERPGGGCFGVYGYAWGEAILPVCRGGNKRIALVHAYTYIKGCGYTDASQEQRLRQTGPLSTYDTVIIGDNHIPWDATLKSGTSVFNCGGFMRRSSDDAHNPRVGLIHEDGSVSTHHLPTSSEHFTPMPHPAQEVTETLKDLGEFVEQLKQLRSDSFDYRFAIESYLGRGTVTPSVRRYLLEALEDGKH